MITGVRNLASIGQRGPLHGLITTISIRSANRRNRAHGQTVGEAGGTEGAHAPRASICHKRSLPPLQPTTTHPPDAPSSPSSPSCTMSKTILVLGATGKQGGSLVAALRPSNGETALFQLLALTRTPASPGARRLASEPHVQVAQGDLDNPASVRKVFDDAGGKGSIWGVFVVLAFPGLGANADGEERQGIVSVLIGTASLERTARRQ